MTKYRKKPLIIEAEQLTRGYAESTIMWIQENGGKITEFNLGEFAEDSCYIEIKTLEGVITASEDDYIIKGIQGEFYPCKPDIFNASYEKVEE